MRCYFNSHAHVERDDSADWGKADVGYFNSHAHVERDDKLTTNEITFFHFNSHAHVERDISGLLTTVNPLISTHTLTWSVTNKPQPYLQILTNFNSHAHVERDLIGHERFKDVFAFQLTRSRGA